MKLKTFKGLYSGVETTVLSDKDIAELKQECEDAGLYFDDSNFLHGEEIVLWGVKVFSDYKKQMMYNRLLEALK